MSTVTNVEATSNKLVTNYDVSKLVLGFNTFSKGTFTDGGAGTTLTAGMIMGRITATGKIVQQDKDAVDGSEFPVGILIEDRTVTAAATVELNLAVGKIAESKVTYKAGTTKASDIDGHQLGDWLQIIGVILMGGTELTKIDNQ